MSKPKYKNFFDTLTNVVYSLDTVEVKLVLGDSINNNRTLTVSQVIRYLLSSSSRKNVALGRSLRTVFNELKEDIKFNRFNNRTDAIDINEFINFYSEAVIQYGEYRALIGRSVAA